MAGVVVAVKYGRAHWESTGFDISYSTYRNLNRRGKAVGEVVPWENASKLLEWWEKWQSTKARAWLLNRVERDEGDLIDEVEKQEPKEPVDFEGVEGTGDMGLSVLRKVVELKGMELAKAYEKGEGVDLAVRAFDKVVDTLRKLEATAQSLAKAGGDLVPWKEVETRFSAEVTRLADNVEAGLLEFSRELAPELKEDYRRKLVQAARDKIFVEHKAA